jgi:hypothetical protein
MSRLRVVALVSALTLAMWWSASAEDSLIAQSPSPIATIATPADGTVTSARWTTVTGTAPAAPKGGETDVTVTIDRRPVVARVRKGTYRVDIALALGRNEIIAKADIYGPDDDAEPVTSNSAPTVVTRVPVSGDGTGTLDRATAFIVTDWSDEAYWLCGEGGCGTKSRCFRVTSLRVDCPTASQWEDDPVWRCGFVMTVRLRGTRVYRDTYGCRGRFRGRPRRFVRPSVWRKGNRFRVNVGNADWLREEINERNLYGVPRFDVDRDVFLP